VPEVERNRRRRGATHGLIGATLPALGVGDDYAGADRESFAAHESFGHAARHYGFEQLAQKIAISLYSYYVNNLAQDAAGGLTGG